MRERERENDINSEHPSINRLQNTFIFFVQQNKNKTKNSYETDTEQMDRLEETGGKGENNKQIDEESSRRKPIGAI